MRGNFLKGVKRRRTVRVTSLDDMPSDIQKMANVRKDAEEIYNYLSGMHRDPKIVYKYSLGQEESIHKAKEIIYNENYNRNLYKFKKRGWLEDILNNYTLIRVTDESTLANLQNIFYFKDHLEPYYYDPNNPKRPLNDWERNSGNFPKVFTLKVHAKNKKAYDKEDYSEEFFDYIFNGPTKETRFDEVVHNYIFIHDNDIDYFENYVKNLLKKEYKDPDHKLRQLRMDELEDLKSEHKKKEKDHRGHNYKDIGQDPRWDYVDNRDMVYDIVDNNGDIHGMDQKTIDAIEEYYINYTLNPILKAYLNKLDSNLKKRFEGLLKAYSFCRYFRILHEFDYKVFDSFLHDATKVKVREYDLEYLKFFKRMIESRDFYSQKPSYFEKDANEIVNKLKNAAIRSYEYKVGGDKYHDLEPQIPAAPISKAEKGDSSKYYKEIRKLEKKYYKDKRDQLGYSDLFKGLGEFKMIERASPEMRELQKKVIGLKVEIKNLENDSSNQRVKLSDFKKVLENDLPKLSKLPKLKNDLEHAYTNLYKETIQNLENNSSNIKKKSFALKLLNKELSKLSRLTKLKEDLEYRDLYYRGALDVFKKCDSIVAFSGSRNIKSKSKEADWIRKKIAELPANTAVMTGLAKGADAIATRAALKRRDLSVIGVPAHGSKSNDPRIKQLTKQILENDGLILSQHHGDYKPNKKDFLSRDDVIVKYTDKIYTPNSDTSGTGYTIKQAKDKGIEKIEKGLERADRKKAKINREMKEYMDAIKEEERIQKEQEEKYHVNEYTSDSSYDEDNTDGLYYGDHHNNYG